MAKIAIIKIGATGDVVRTSVLLRLFKNDDITWITARGNKVVLPYQLPNLTKVMAIEDIQDASALPEQFDLVISLDDDLKCASLASALKSKDLFGAYVKEGKIVYTDSANEWFDMGLSSRFGKQRADEIKWENKSSYQEILFRMLGHTFNNDEYVLREDIQVNNIGIIGIEARAGARWPTKVWNQYEQLAEVLKEKGHEIVFFEERPKMETYMQDIGNTSMFIGGDTLGMHIALALKLPSVVLFTCTSAVEIHGYNRMEKIVSPHLKEAFYKTAYIPEAVNSIGLETVLAAVERAVVKM